MMLKQAPAAVVNEAFRRIRTAFRSGPSRLRLRRRLYLYAAPVLIVLLVVAAKMISVVIAGNSAISDFDRHDIDALRGDISILEFVDVIDPAKTSFATGDLMVLEGRLADAEARFQESLSRTDAAASCPVRVNLELVQETLGDIATRSNDRAAAEKWYNTAISVVKEAPAQCFEGNDDANEDRRAIRAEALPRLEQKLKNLDRPPPPPPSPPETITPPPPPTSLIPTSAPPLPGLGGGGSPSPSPGAPPSQGESPGGSPSQGETPGAQPSQGQAPGGPPSAGQSPDGAPSPGQAPDGAGQTPGAAPPPGPGPNMPSPQAPEPTMTPGPGPNMPTPPTAAGGDAPVVGPEGGGPDVLNPVSPDRLPSVGGGSAPGQRLGVGRGEPLDQLKDLLDNANAHGENRE
ncbi:hypothetical protein H7J87_14125 [Mycolicibacterium wolinskyi]|uniref:Uncharacterized protein n=1 Tax=Mycolicibacterium wolinskyi TaxID=59750 RepID=A0A1X2F8S0_9MYCO|nr:MULTISPECIES: hypothetical protein [Mycolicibacterium]MCV7286462.1 hypothetical protein [Mycolicibacterium wolinskyi]MCV7293442.1 hypothetical protein [Mycolicibacterium goodii]ORX14807.1 hypothetical protein AWC31_26990 [Mycolicibacterium wolinskyi]